MGDFGRSNPVAGLASGGRSFGRSRGLGRGVNRSVRCTLAANHGRYIVRGTMPTQVYLSDLGRPVAPEQAKVSAFDRGFLYGDSVYETMRTAGGHPVELRRHLDRLRRSGEGIGLEIPFSDEAIAGAIAETHAATGNTESTIRVVVTRGGGPMVLDPRDAESPLLVVYVRELSVPAAADYISGLSAVIVDVHKTGRTLLDPSIKSGNYLNNILALRRAIARSGQDAIMLGRDGEVAEGATSNVFMIRDGKLRTPALEVGILPGITRQVVLEIAAELGIDVAQTRIEPDELRAADEVFLTSSVRGIMPVTTLDGDSVGAGTAGPITRRLRERYETYIRETADPALRPG